MSQIAIWRTSITALGKGSEVHSWCVEEIARSSCGWIEVRRRELEVEDEEAARVQIIQDTADIKNDIGAYAKYDRKSLESFEEEGDLTF